MSEAVAAPRPDTSDMVSVHKVFREALASAPQMVGSVSPGDTGRAALIASYYANVLAFLHVHHEAEDELLWPRLVERAPQHAEMVNRIAGQHDGVTASLAAAEGRLAEWTPEPSAAHGAALVTALTALGDELGTHLDEEEREILPLAAEHLTAAEWGEMPAHGMKHFAGDKVWLLIGLLQDAFTPEQRAHMIAHMPPPVLDFWTNVGRLQYASFIAELRPPAA